METGLVSCIIPTYKRSDMLVRAIKSALSQTYRNIEIIVVDDNHPGDEYSLDVQRKIESIADDRVRLIRQERHINGAAARNSGIMAAKGEYIAFLDDDDEWLPEKTSKQVDLLNENSGVDGVFVLSVVYKNNLPIQWKKPYGSDNIHLKIFRRDISVATPTVLVRKKALDEAGYFDESLRRHQELQFLLDFTLGHKVLVLNEYLVKVHLDDALNRPDVDALIEIKKNYFASVKRHLERYGKAERQSIFRAHYFEIVQVALRERKILIALKYLFKIGINIPAYRRLWVRYRARKYRP